MEKIKVASNILSKKISYLFLLSCIGLASCFSDGNKGNEGNKITIHGFNNIISFYIPQNWESIESTQQQQRIIHRFVPANKSDESRNELLTVDAYASQPQELSPEKFIGQLVEGQKVGCTGESIFKPIDSGRISGFKSAAAIYSCTIGSKSRVGYTVIIEAKNKDFYTIDRATIGQLTLQELSKRLNQNNFQKYLSEIQPIVIK